MSGSDTTTTRYAGTRVSRVEDPRLLTGHGTFVDDVVRPGMLHVCFVRSPIARARITGVDVSGALELDGVHAVYTAADINPHVNEQWFSLEGKHSPDTPRPPLAEGEVRFVGDPVAMVIADDRYIAEDAAEQVIVDYEPLTPVVDYAAGLDSADLVHEAYPGNLIGQIGGRPMADLEPAFAGAAHVVSETFYQQAHCPMPMETRGLVTEWSAPDRTMTIWTATQSPHEVRMFCARLLAIPEHAVRVVMRDTGGGFGQKVLPLREDMCLMIAATKIPAPLKWIEDRQEHLLSAGQARHEHGEARMAFDADGNLLAATLDHVQDAGAYPSPNPVQSGYAVGLIFPGPYRIPEGTFLSRFAFSNTSGRVAYRGPWQFESVAREVLLDKAARQIGIDPIELRRKNMLRPDELPTANCNGMPYSDITPLATLNQAVEMLGYEEFRREQEQARANGRYLGVGTCTYVEPTAAGNSLYATEGATIRIEPSGKVNVYVAGGSCGNSLETTVIQLAADALDVPIEDVSTIQGDTAVTPFGGGTGGSRSGPMTAGAVTQVGGVLRERVVALAAHLLGVPVEEVDFVRGRASVKGSPEKQVTLAEIAETAYFKTGSLPADLSVELEASGRYRAGHLMLWANATHLCTCEVDVVTGEVKILRYIVSEDVGPMINPNVVEGQIFGGTVQGIGGALYEHLAYDDSGNPVTTTFMDYLLPTAAEVPTIEVGHVETPSIGPGGYKGVGEGGAIGAPPAVINAVADALAPFGVRISRLPLSPAAIVGLLDDAERRNAAAEADLAGSAVA